jgi:glycine betaine catabolism B
MVLKLQEKTALTPQVIAFKFMASEKIKRVAGQYFEWTLNHPNPDERGIKRFFTIASSPTEDFILLTTKFYDKPSTFKQALKLLEPGDEILANDLQGEFTLPLDQNRKLVWIAGGIGITPFRAMTKYLLDTGEKKDIVLLYSNKNEQEIIFKELLDQAEEIGLKTIFVNTDQSGYIDQELIKTKIPDWAKRLFYLSGPEAMVEAFEKWLLEMGISEDNLKRDYFDNYTETHQG